MKDLEKRLSLKEKEIYEKLKDVKDPEFDFCMIERNLVDEINKTYGRCENGSE